MTTLAPQTYGGSENAVVAVVVVVTLFNEKL